MRQRRRHGGLGSGSIVGYSFVVGFSALCYTYVSGVMVMVVMVVSDKGNSVSCDSDWRSLHKPNEVLRIPPKLQEALVLLC